MKKTLIILATLLLTFSCTIKVNPYVSESKWLGIITEEKCSKDRYLERAKIASSCIMDNEIFRISAWEIHDTIINEFKSKRSDKFESFLDSVIMLNYLDGYSNYSTDSFKKMEYSTAIVENIIDTCFDKPAGIIKCKKITRFEIRNEKYKPSEYSYGRKKSKWYKCSEVTEPEHITECKN